MKKILLVEDNELNLDMLSRRLRRKGYHVVTAVDGGQALEMMATEQPAVVLLDINLPVKNGWTVLSEARGNADIGKIPIIALTAHAMSGDRERAMAAGCNDYETKPIDLPILLAKIEKLSNTSSDV